MRLLGRGHQADRRLARAGHHALKSDYQRLAADLLAQQPAAGLLVHSDWGGQYCGKAYRALLHAHETIRSQRRRGAYYDNDQAESRWSRFKTEALERHAWPFFTDLADA